jgi:O-antigen ligase
VVQGRARPGGGAWRAGTPATPYRLPVDRVGPSRPARRLIRSAGEPADGALATVAVALALMALVAPKLPLHAGPIDAVMALAIFVAFLWALRSGAKLRMPFVIPMTALVATGLLAALVGASPHGGAVAAVQEIFLLVWCAAIATVCRTPRALGIVLRAWALSATAWAALLIASVVTGVTAIAGTTGEVGTRARLFFDHPNMAGNYFMIGVFIVVASGYPRRLPLRIVACLILVSAMFLTGSNAALLSLIGGGVVVLFLNLRARKGLIQATAVVAVLVGGLGIGWVEVAAPLVQAAQQSDNPLFRYSVGRGARSADNRESLFLSQLQLFEQGNLLGIGPAATRAALGDAAATTVKEAHNDYLGTLVERGPLGALALAGLIGAAVARSVRITRRPLPPHLAKVVPVPAALVGAAAAFALTALTHEVLHYRWLWALFGVLAALHLLLRAGPGDPGHAPSGDPPRAGLVPVTPRVR